MSDLVFSLIPVALGVVLSPLAIMALVAVRLSRRSSRLSAPQKSRDTETQHPPD